VEFRVEGGRLVLPLRALAAQAPLFGAGHGGHS
jgi:hypothetical protein